MTGTQGVDLQSVATALTAAAERAPDRKLTGSQAANVVRQQDPYFSPSRYGCGSLRQLITRHVPQLTEVGASGLDPVYGLVGHPPQSVPSAQVESALATFGGGTINLWRVWVSPRSPAALAVSKMTGHVRAVPVDSGPSATEAVVQPASQQAHRDIARSFLEKTVIDLDLRETLNALYRDPHPNWWQRWMMALKTKAPKQHDEWQAYRHHQLEDLLRHALEDAGLTSRPIERAMSVAIVARAKLTGISSPSIDDAVAALPAPRRQSEPGHETMVGLVQAVVARMNEHELRALNLPVGLVLDAMSERARR